MADTRCLDPDEDLAGSGWTELQWLDAEWLAGLVEDGGTHGTMVPHPWTVVQPYTPHP